MTLYAECPSCGKGLRTRDEHTGKLFPQDKRIPTACAMAFAPDGRSAFYAKGNGEAFRFTVRRTAHATPR